MNITKRREAVEKKIALLHVELANLKKLCKHENVKREFKSDTGNYDPSKDCYWVDHYCPDCGAKWRVYD
jgi:hypothetical protein